MTQLTCTSTVLATRTAVGVDTAGYTLWGVTNANCITAGRVSANFGLNVPTPNVARLAGWDDDNNGACGCNLSFSPAAVTSHRGYFGLRR